MLTIIPLARSMFSMLFASVRRETQFEPPALAAMINSTLRAIYAGSWIVVPGLVAWWISASGGRAMIGVFLVAAVAALMIAVVTYLFAPSGRQQAEAMPFNLADAFAAVARRDILLRLLAVAFLSAAMTLHMASYPLIMTKVVGGSMRDVGILAGLYAALEIPFMLIWAWIAARSSMGVALIAAGIIYALYCTGLGLADQRWHVYALAVLNACGAAAILSLPVSYFQDMIRERPGLSTSLQPLMVFVGGLISSAGFATGTAIGGYSGAALVAGLMAVIACSGLWFIDVRKA